MVKTVNGGSTWTNVSTGIMDDFYSVCFLNVDKGYVVSWRGDILKTLDGGLSWINDSSGTWNPLYSVFFTDSTTGYVVGAGGTILKQATEGKHLLKSIKQSLIFSPSCLIPQKPSSQLPARCRHKKN